MEPHIDFVGVLFIVWGLLTTLVGVSTLALGVGAIAVITSASRGGEGGQFAAGVTAAVFTTLRLTRVADVLRVTIDHPHSELNAVDEALHRDFTTLFAALRRERTARAEAGSFANC